jgi:hypothetical protein
MANQNAQQVHHGETVEHERLDQQVIQQSMMALRVIAPLNSRIGEVLEERFAELYEKLGDSIDPAKRSGMTAANQDQVTKEPEPLEQTAAIGLGAQALTQDLGPTPTLTTGPTSMRAGPGVVEITLPKPSSLAGVQTKTTPSVESSQVSWTWVLSQLLRKNLKRLGLEPDEMDDIRVFLIKNEAAKYEKLELLSRLPDSLSPEAATKIFEDIRTMAAGYIAYVFVERVKSQVEEQGELKQMPELPRSVISPFYGIETLEFDPEDVLRKLG